MAINQTKKTILSLFLKEILGGCLEVSDYTIALPTIEAQVIAEITKEATYHLVTVLHIETIVKIIKGITTPVTPMLIDTALLMKRNTTVPTIILFIQSFENLSFLVQKCIQN